MKRLVGMVLAWVCLAAQAVAEPGEAGTGEIKSIDLVTNAAGYVEALVRLNSPINDDACPSGTIVISSASTGENIFDHMYTLSLSAYVSKQTVSFYSHAGDCIATTVSVAR